LSVMMVLSLVAPTGAQAASKYTLTNKTTVKAGTNYKYQLKGVSTKQYVKVTRNVSGETVKYNKKAVTKTTKIKGTGKTLNLYVKYSEKNKNYTGKFTVKIYNKKTNKVAKSIVEKVTVKSQAKVAVTSVAIDNATPIVGDTLKATITPAKAKITAYEWKAGNDVVSKATEYTVTTADLGKKITVSVTDSFGNIKTSEATAEVTDTALEVVSAEQTGANTVKVVMNKAITKDDVVTLAKGTAAQKTTATLAEDNKTIEITTADKIVTATYTVTVTPKDTAIKAASKSFKGAAQELKSLQFGKELALASASDFYTAYAHLAGVDQWGAEYGIPAGKVTVYASTATKNSEQKYDAKTQTVTVEKDKAAGQLPFTLGEKITLTAIYKNNSEVIQTTGEVTVSNAAYVAEMTFGELTTDKAAYKDKKVTMDRFYNGGYYLPVVAKDQYGNTLKAKQLTKAVEASALFITPTAANSVYAGFDKFDDLDNGKTVMYVNSKATDAMPGEAVLNISALGGYTTSTKFTVEDNPYIDSLTFEVPGTLYAGTRVELEVNANDQYGDSVDLYEMLDTCGNTAIVFKDKNGISKNNTTIKASTGNFSCVKNSKKVTFYYTPQGAANSSVTFTVQTASNKVNTQTFTIQTAGTLTKIAKFDSKVTKNTAPSKMMYDVESAVVFEDSNGDTVDYKNAKFPSYSTDGTATQGVYWNVYKNADLTTEATVSNGILTVDGTKGADVNYYVALKSKPATGDTVVLDSEKVTVHIARPDENNMYKSYRAVWYNGKDLFNVVGDTAKVVVYGTDKDGVEVSLKATDDFTVTANSDFEVNGNTVTQPTGGKAIAVASSEKEANVGKFTATVWAKDGSKACELAMDYSNAPRKATAAYGVAECVRDADHIWYPAMGDSIKLDAGDVLGNDGIIAVQNGGLLKNYYLGVEDQYGNDMEPAIIVNGQKTTTNTTVVNGQQYTYTVSVGAISKTITVNEGAGNAVAEAQTAANAAAAAAHLALPTEFTTAGAAATNTTDGYDYTYSIVLAAGHSPAVEGAPTATIGGADGKITITAGTSDDTANTNVYTITVTASKDGVSGTKTYTLTVKDNDSNAFVTPTLE
jgi:hypothetical protein